MALQLNNKLVCLQEPTQRTRTAIICSAEGKTFNCSCVIASVVGSLETKMFSRHLISPLFHAEWYQASYTDLPQC